MANEAAQALMQLRQQQQGFFDQAAQTQAAQSTRRTPGTGVGIVDLFTRGSREEKAKAEDIAALEAQQQVQAFQGGNLFDAQGFNPGFAGTQQGQALQQAFTDTPQAALQTAQSLRTAGATATDRLATQGIAQARFDQQVKLDVQNTEDSLRGEWQKMIAPTVRIMQGVDFARSQMELGSPAAAFNGVRLFINQIDESMITNPEIEAQLAAAGVAGHIANMKSWIEGGGQFDDISIQQMTNSMAAIGEVMQRNGDILADQMTELVNRSDLGLNPENVVTLAGFGKRDTDLSINPVTRPPLLQGGAGTPDPDLGQQAIGTGIGEMLTLPDGTEVRRIE